MDEAYSCDDERQLVTPDVRIYKRRWWVLAVGMLVSSINFMSWNVFGSTADTAVVLYNWTFGTIDLLVNIGNICVVFLVFPWMYMMERFGLRVSVVITALLQFAATLFRLVPLLDDKNATVYFYLAQLLNGAANPVVVFMHSRVSALWFPPEERTTATAFGVSSWAIGSTICFAQAAALVRSVPAYPQPDANDSSVTPVTMLPSYDLEELKSGMDNLFYVQVGITSLSVVLTLLYYPSKPPTPPSVSAEENRAPFFDSVTAISKSWRAWFLIVVFSLQNGPFTSWQNLLVQDFAKLSEMSQQELSMLGLIATMASIPATVVYGWYTDKFQIFSKWSTVVMYALGALLMTWMVLVAEGYIPFSKVQVYIFFIAGSCIIYSLVPIVYEWTVEACYPASESTATGILQFFNTIIGAIFLLALQFSCQGNPGCAGWYNWYQALCMWCMLPLVAAYKPIMQRDMEDAPQAGGDSHVPTNSSPAPAADLDSD